MADAKVPLDPYEKFLQDHHTSLRTLTSTDDVPRLATGIAPIDTTISPGGLPKGKIIEVYGPEGGGKTTFTLHCMAAAQARGERVAFVDAEHALNPQYAAALGVDTSKLVISQPPSGEQAFDAVTSLVKSGFFGLVVIDSVAGMVPQAELDGEMDATQQPGTHARLMGRGLRRITGVAEATGTTVLFVNQTRMKIGVSYGSPETTPGGNALKFFASIRLDIRRIGAVKVGEAVVGNRCRIKAVKNKYAPPFREEEIDLIFGAGFDSLGWLLDQSILNGLVEKSGAWLSFGGERLGQGRIKALAHIRDTPELMARFTTAAEEMLR